MGQRTFTRDEVGELLSLINNVLGGDDGKTILKTKVHYAIARNRIKLKRIAVETEEILTEMDDRRKSLRKKYCLKDANGTPLFEADGKTLKGLSVGVNNDYDTEIQDLLKEVRKIRSESVTVDVYEIKEEWMPTECSMQISAITVPFFEDE